NSIGIPLAAGAFIKAFGWTLNPMFGAAAMSLSSFCVVTNALRLNWVKLGNKQQATGNRRREEEAAGEHAVVVMVKGMMCHNCERHVREALEALPGVESAEADFRTGLVKIRGEVPEAALRAAVKAAGYQFKKTVK
ncbi:MAG: cation transporter, partial [Oscillospiraceae bacterium]|nr:cation transporter [Oscillospiraceae bacterium]